MENPPGSDGFVVHYHLVRIAMSAPPLPPAPPPADARRAAVRTRDAVRAARSRVGFPAGPGIPFGGGAEVDVVEPEAALPVSGLARALAEAAARPDVRLVPGGGFAGAPFPAEELYVTSWEFQLLAAERAVGPAEMAPGAAEAPVAVRGRGGDGPTEFFRPWLVHSFAGRKGHARPDVLALVPASARSVLDVGCGEGVFGASLEARGARVTGIELDERAAEVAARRLSRVLSVRAEEAVGSLDVRPDVIVLADVLEHLVDPAGVLRTLREALSPGGRLVFSVPNATHASVLGGAFRGHWDRELEGIVADDHRTYAGREGWTALLASCGYRVTSLLPAAARTARSGGDRAAFLASTGLSAEDLDAVQWLGTAEPSAPGSGAPMCAAVEVDGPLGGEDPVGAVAERAGSGGVVLETRNPVRARVLETLLRGGLVAGEDAMALLSGWTPAGLASRFEGSGLGVLASPASGEPLSRAVREVVEARRSEGLPTDEAALAASSWSVTFRPSGS
ncbi:MAG: class I SAM-dependent methyltransferase [Holophagales bacterium]|nr:class I SAM-dependent methyltransferase [Holophagales bacterium]